MEKFELLATKGTKDIYFMKLEDRDKATTTAKAAAAKGYGCMIMMTDDNGKRHCAEIGKHINWNNYRKIVEVSFGEDYNFTYLTRKEWKVGDERKLKTRRGISYGTIATEPKYVHKSFITTLENCIGYSLSTLEDCIIDEKNGETLAD